jgi:capsid protein
MAKPKMNFWHRAKAATKFLFNYGGTGRGYSAAVNTRYRGRRSYTEVLPEEQALDRSDRGRIVSTLLDFRRNNSLVKSLCRLRETDVVGNGITPRPQTGDEILDERLEELWHEYARMPEVTCSMTMRELQQQLASMPLIFGDGGMLLTRTGKVQLVEGDRIGTEDEMYPWKNPSSSPTKESGNPTIDGVEISKLGKPLAYHIGERADTGGVTNTRRIRANDFMMTLKWSLQKLGQHCRQW